MGYDSLVSAGLRTTLPRRLILDTMENSQERHLGAEEIYQLLRDAGEEIGIATVYRVLTQFEQAGIVLRHRFGSDKSYYELNDECHHDHLVCIECGKVYEFVDAEIEQRQVEIAKSAGFYLQDHSLHLYGVCEGMRLHGKCSLKAESERSIHQFDK